MRLNQKCAIIIGVAKGIGKAVARTFAQEGARLFLVDCDKEGLEILSNELTAEGASVYVFHGDIRSQKSMDAMAHRAEEVFGRIDILVQVAGIFPQSRIGEMTVAQWDEVIDTNLKGTFLAVRACLPIMQKQKYGRIVLTSSTAGPRLGWAGAAHYTASKAGINGFMRTAAVEFAEYGISINSVEPGSISTNGMTGINPDWIEAREKAIPLKRLGSVDEVAKVHLFLASDEASYITGQSIIVDGGQLLPECHHPHIPLSI